MNVPYQAAGRYRNSYDVARQSAASVSFLLSHPNKVVTSTELISRHNKRHCMLALIPKFPSPALELDTAVPPRSATVPRNVGVEVLLNDGSGVKRGVGSEVGSRVGMGVGGGVGWFDGSASFVVENIVGGIDGMFVDKDSTVGMFDGTSEGEACDGSMVLG